MILTLVKDFPFDRQKRILLRESLIALALAIFFQFFGEAFLSALAIQSYAVTLCGGVMLFFLALNMIFPNMSTEQQEGRLQEDPLIVPIATPLIAGPGVLSVVMLFSQQENDPIKIMGAILIAWIGVTAVLTGAPYIQKVLGRRGMITLEQLMGMILSMLSTDMLVRGMALFIKTTQVAS